MQCPNCASVIAAGKKFCTLCGSPAPIACPSCGGVNAASARFCGDCGAKLDGGAIAAPQAARPQQSIAGVVAGRRLLTVMFCDLVGSTELASRLDPEIARELIGAYRNCVAETVAQFEGFIAQYLGDGVLCYFGYPRALEDDAERAVRAALAVVAEVGRLERRGEAALQARVGVATGVVVVGEQIGASDSRGPAAVGDTPNLAARLQALAAPDEVVISESTRRLLGRMFDLREMPNVRLKGVGEPLTAYAVLRPSSIASRFDALRASGLTPLVGREEELELLLRRWAQAKGGEGRVILLSGDPGIGKSHIAESLLVRLGGEQHVRLRYFCAPHHTHSPFYPFIAQLERAACFEPGSSTGAKLDKLEVLLKSTAKNVPRDLALIADLLSVPVDGRYPALAVSPQQKREMTLMALLDQLDGIAAQGPVLIVFEDIHWIDPTSLDLLDRTIARVADLPVLLVVTFRPELQPAWVGQPHVTMLPLAVVTAPASLAASPRARRCPTQSSSKCLPTPTACRCSSRS
jgi:class 3 adenylate cyclase